MTEKIRAAGGQTVTLTYERDGQTITPRRWRSRPRSAPPRTALDARKTASQLAASDLEQVGATRHHAGGAEDHRRAGRRVGLAVDQTGVMFTATFEALKKFPEKVPKLWTAVTGGERDPETPISVVGASRIGGELFEQGEMPTFLLLLAGLNFFVGLFNLLPLLPLDGGHIAISWFERARSWLYARLRKPDPGRVDYMKLMPVTYAVILVFGGFTVLTVAADIVNPITLFK